MTTAAATTALELAGDAKLEEAANGGKPSIKSMIKRAGAMFMGTIAAVGGGSLIEEVKGLTKAVDTVMNTSSRMNADAMSGKCGKGSGIGCFIAGTKVKTIEGDRNIEDIEVGDYVLAENVETGEQEYKEVTQTFTYEKTAIVHVYVGDEEIETTLEHPFYVEGLGFVSAGELQAGDIIRTSDGRNLPIKKIEIEELEETVIVYNFEVEDFHTYYVSELGVLVHNWCGDDMDIIKSSESVIIVGKNGKASDLPIIEKGTKEWDSAVKNIANGGNTSYRTRTATDAKALLYEARGNMNRYKRYKRYSSDKKRKGYEMHPDERNTYNAPHNDLPHLKWKDWIDKVHPGTGHIFFDIPN